MIYREDEIERRLSLGEDSRWEFKRIEFSGNRPRSHRRNDLADEIAAFANADGGVLLCGVADDGEVQDMSREQLAELDVLLVEAATESVEPAIRIESLYMELSGGRRILLTEVPEGDSLHRSPGGSLVRVGSSKQRMPRCERHRLAQRRSRARNLWFDMQPLPDTGFETLDESLWKPLLSAEGAANPKTALRRLAVLAHDSVGILRATVAGVLLCTRSPERWLPGACITATCHRGRDRTSGQVDSQEIAGPLNRQIEDAMAFAIRNTRVSARKTPARVDLPQYSDKVLFEALVNAVAHRDYSIQGSRIRLSMFDDRLEIQAPGSLPKNLTLDSMAHRYATRNEVLTSLLRQMPVNGIRGSEDRRTFMERRGDGVSVIRRKTRELSGRFPEYSLIDDSEVRLTIPAAEQDLSAARITVTAWSDGQPVSGVNILVLFPNKTWKRAVTDSNGEAVFDLHMTHLPMIVFAASAGYAACVVRDWIPAQKALALDMQEMLGGGSVIFSEETCRLPGLKGCLNPIRDSWDRTYYASNIAVNEGQQQPVHFTPGEDLRLTDSDGRQLIARIIDIMGRSALVEYRLNGAGSVEEKE